MVLQQSASVGGFDAKTALYIALVLIAIFYIVVIVRGLRSGHDDASAPISPTPGGLVVGFVTNFFDTLGIGSFATTTAMFRQWKMVRDEKIPGTLNIGHTLATVAQAFIFTKIVPVEPMTLILMIAAAVLGAWLGAGVVAGWPRRKIQIGMGVCLLVVGSLFLSQALKLSAPTGNAISLEGPRLAIGLVGNFILGALMTLGIGLYGPCLILVSLLGMNSATGFPIMMGSCAFLMPVASARFVRERKFDPRAVMGLLIGGVPAVLIAAYFFSNLGIEKVRWLVIVVVFYTAITMLRSASKERSAKAVEEPMVA